MIIHRKSLTALQEHLIETYNSNCCIDISLHCFQVKGPTPLVTVALATRLARGAKTTLMLLVLKLGPKRRRIRFCTC